MNQYLATHPLTRSASEGGDLATSTREFFAYNRIGKDHTVLGTKRSPLAMTLRSFAATCTGIHLTYWHWQALGSQNSEDFSGPLKQSRETGTRHEL